MKILFTGASSFSGFWFAKELAEAGHEVVAAFRGAKDSYSDIRNLRIEKLLPHCRSVFSCPFGGDSFFQVIERESWDLLCHHAADVTNYKSADFAVIEALRNNTYQVPKLLPLLQQKGCNRIVLTGSVFEQGEGGEIAVSPYGLSKGLTSDFFRYYCSTHQMQLSKFVIPNPFGPLEEKRFTYYLMNEWLHHRVAEVKQPLYVRDNIPVTLLAKAYLQFVEEPSRERYNPSWKPESQGDFTKRLSLAISSRLSLPCSFTLSEQKEFTEPFVRINHEPIEAAEWEESKALDQFAEYYLNTFKTF